jgi:hypothetical protein
MDVAVRQFAVPDVGKVVRMVGVVVAVNEPDALPNNLQLDVQRAGGFQVAQQNDGAGVGVQGRIDDVLPLAVRVAAEKEWAGVQIDDLTSPGNQCTPQAQAHRWFWG